MKKIFVYGTLKQGYPLNGWLMDEVILDHYYTTPYAHYELYDLGGFPGMQYVGEGGYQIRGEVWSMEEGTERSLNHAEGSAFELRTLPPEPDMYFYEYLYGGELMEPVAFQLKEWKWSSYRSTETEKWRGQLRSI